MGTLVCLVIGLEKIVKLEIRHKRASLIPANKRQTNTTAHDVGNAGQNQFHALIILNSRDPMSQFLTNLIVNVHPFHLST